jgi:hypothetical protein
MNIDFFETGLCFYCHLTKNELREYQEFHQKTEESWKGSDAKIRDQINELINKHPDANETDIVESYAWDLHLSQSKYPDIHRNSLVISLYIFLEQQLNGLCEIISESLKTKVVLRDIAGQGVERSLLFLKKVACFDLGKLPSLAFIKGFNRLRNTLVHADGRLPGTADDKLNKFLRASKGLRGNPSEYVSLSPEFVDYSIGRLIEFFDELDSQTQEFMQRIQQLAAADAEKLRG